MADLVARADHGLWSNREHRADPPDLEPRLGWAMGSAGIARELLRYARCEAGARRLRSDVADDPPVSTMITGQHWAGCGWRHGDTRPLWPCCRPGPPCVRHNGLIDPGGVPWEFMQVIQGKVADRAGSRRRRTSMGRRAGCRARRLPRVHLRLPRRRHVRRARPVRVRGGGPPQQRASRAGRLVGRDGEVLRRRGHLHGLPEHVQLARPAAPTTPDSCRSWRAHHQHTADVGADGAARRPAAKEGRPEIIGGTLGSYDSRRRIRRGGRTSPPSRRPAHTKRSPSPTICVRYSREARRMGEVDYFDLREPMLVSARR